MTIDMSTFNVSLRTPGNNKGLSATVRLEDRRLSITAGEHEIGEWPLSDLQLEATGTGYRIMAEGELVILDFESVSAFERELAEASKSRKGRKQRSAKEKQTKREKAPKVESAQETVEAETAQETVGGETDSEQVLPAQPEPEAPPTTPTTPPRTRTTRVEKPEGGEPFKDKVLRLLDNGLASAEEKAGALLPAWVFTRGAAASLLVVFVLALVLPGLASTVLFILGAIVVILGAIAYSDDMLASRWLPGRATPTHVLIAGVVFILLGVLFALIAR